MSFSNTNQHRRHKTDAVDLCQEMLQNSDLDQALMIESLLVANNLERKHNSSLVVEYLGHLRFQKHAVSHHKEQFSNI